MRQRLYDCQAEVEDVCEGEGADGLADPVDPPPRRPCGDKDQRSETAEQDRADGGHQQHGRGQRPAQK